MIESVDRTRPPAPVAPPSDDGRTRRRGPARPGDGERAARRALAGQVERLERQLAELASDSWRGGRREPVAARPGPGRRPRLLDLGELERLRDELAGRVEDGRRELAERRRAEQANRDLLADMLRDPAAHRWVRVGHADIGEPGCRHYHVVPRWGIVGALANWWRVKISSGCP